MQTASIIAAFALAFVCIAHAGPVILSAENFESETSSAPTFVKFYAPWCGHCVSLAPTWDTLADKVHSELEGKAKIAKVDCTVEQDIASKYNVRGYPTLMLLKPNGDKVPYQGARDESSLYDFVKKNIEA